MYVFCPYNLRINVGLTTINNNLNQRIRNYGETPTTLAKFVQDTAIDTSSIVLVHFKDTNNILGAGANIWCKGFLQYQNVYGSQYSVYGEGIFYWSGVPYYVLIDGSSSFTITKKQIIKAARTRLCPANGFVISSNAQNFTIDNSTNFDNFGLYLSTGNGTDSIVITVPKAALTVTSRFPVTLPSGESGTLNFSLNNALQVRAWTSANIITAGYKYFFIYGY